MTALVMDCSVGLPGKGGRFRLRIVVTFLLNPRGSEAISGANSLVIRVANRFTSRAQFRSLTGPKTLLIGSAGGTAETPASAGVIASRLTMGFGTLCSIDITIPLCGD